MPSILIEVCFVDSSADAELYRARFSEIATAIADVLRGDELAAYAA
jgi:N-acetylmuramoyl-L-alanine amidase